MMRGMDGDALDPMVTINFDPMAPVEKVELRSADGTVIAEATPTYGVARLPMPPTPGLYQFVYTIRGRETLQQFEVSDDVR